MTALPPGSKLGRFEISGVLGEGAMGIVYLAHDPQIDRPVALKTLRAEAISGEFGPEIESRFLKEAKLAGRLSHPNVVTIYEAGQDGGVAYIAMEHVDGESLTRWLRSGEDRGIPQRIDIVRQVALALEHAHDRAVLHRDIKPGNILITREGRVKVADFGIGKLLAAPSVELTRTGHMLGSPAYMSPEQIRGEKLDGRSDLFSLGVVLYELLTGVRPFPGDSITTLVYQILHTEPRDPLLVRSDLPAGTTKLFQRLLAKSPENRPADAREFVRELARIESRMSREQRTVSMAPAPAAGPPAAVDAATVITRDRRPVGPAYLFGAAAVLLATAVLVWIVKPTPSRVESGAAAKFSTTAAPEVSVAAAPTEIPASGVTSVALPTAGPAAAADAIVGAPRLLEAGATPAGSVRSIRRTLTALARTPVSASEETGRQAPTPVAVASIPSAPREGVEPDKIYRTRRFAKFNLSPDQARLSLDGRYVGIADDWDDRGGGKTLEIGREGAHRVRVELPGYRTLHLEIVVSSSAEDETVDIGDDLKRESKQDYPKIPKVDEATVGPVEFVKIDPPDAVVSEGGRTLGPAASFGPDSPLRLSGPMVHDLVISAPGRKSKTVRILVASNADSERAKVKAELKKQ